MSRDDAFDPLAETISANLAETAADSMQLRARAIEPATKIGRFVVIGKLGQGGMGVVVAAFDPQLDRKVAIKMLHDTVSSSQAVRLEREAKAMAQLNHPNVVTIHETGTHEGSLYIAMEYVDGQTFRQWLRAKPRTHAEVFDIMLQAGRGLAAAHAAGLVHRDFKPDNVLVGNDGRARVSDFGLVMAALEEAPTPAGPTPSSTTTSPPTDLTQTGSVLGTPLYMAPEQHGGRVADAKADQFSYCVTLWQALCEELPYGADSYEALVTNITGGNLRPVPSGVRLPATLRAILARGLASEPAARFPSMPALLAAIERARHPARRWPVIAALAGVVLVGTGVAVALALRGGGDRAVVDPCLAAGVQHVWDRARATAVGASLARADAREVAPAIASSLERYAATWTEHRVATCRATQSAELLDLRMRCLDDRLASLETLVARFGEVTTRDAAFHALGAAGALSPLDDCDDAARLRAAIPLPADPAKRARIIELERRTADAISYDRMGEFARAIALVVPLEREAREVGYPPLVAKLVLLRAGEQFRSGDLAGAEQGYRDAAELAATARDDERIAQAWTDLVTLLAARSKFAEALALVPIARTAVQRVSDRPLLGARFANAVAGIYLTQANYPEARREYEEALALAQKNGGDNELVGPALTNMGLILWYTGDPVAAAKYFEDGRAWLVARYGPKHPTLGYVHRNLGDLAVQKPDFAAAIAHYLEAQTIFEAAHGPDGIDVAIALDPLIYAYGRTGELAKARAVGERDLALRGKTLGADHVSLATPLVNLGDVDLIEGTPTSLAHARELYLRALALQEAAYGKDAPQLANTLDNLADAAQRLGDHAAAYTVFERSLAIRVKQTGDHTAETATLHVQLGDVELDQKRWVAALADFERAEAIFAAVAPKDPTFAGARFGHARALWSMGKRVEARALAITARDLGPPQRLADAIDAWLATSK